MVNLYKVTQFVGLKWKENFDMVFLEPLVGASREEMWHWRIKCTVIFCIQTIYLCKILLKIYKIFNILMSSFRYRIATLVREKFWVSSSGARHREGRRPDDIASDARPLQTRATLDIIKAIFLGVPRSRWESQRPRAGRNLTETIIKHVNPRSAFTT